MSYSALLHEANVLATRVSQLEQAVPDTYERMMVEARALAGRVTVLESAVPPVVPQRIQVSNFRLIGGWRLVEPFGRAGLAIDLANNRCWAGSANWGINQFNLPPMTRGTDVNQYTRVWPSKHLGNFWGRGNPTGLQFQDGLLWVSPRVHYDTQPTNLTIFGMNLDNQQVTQIATTLSMPGFGGGFIHGHSQRLLGCGGYESGQGSKSGPTLATVDSQILMDKANHGTMDWNSRERRPPNYRCLDGDTWLGLNPRNGEGRWCSDMVYAGGIWNPRGLCYWAMLAVGDLAYAHQSEGFAIGENKECWLYTYDPVTFGQVEFSKWSGGIVHGHAIGPDGLVYLLERNAWSSQLYKVDSAIKVYEVAA